MSSLLRFDPVQLPPETEQLRAEVRAFIAAEVVEGSLASWAESDTSFNPAFSKKLGARGWIGMTWPKTYGGHERSALERYVVVEELLAAGAPLSSHWVADRQSGPLLLRYGSEAQKRAVLPRIARGELCFCIGMSEPNSGSDLASVQTTAIRAGGGWRLNGTKLWTSWAHKAHYMIALARTSPLAGDKHVGLSQFLVDLSLPGIEIRPIYNLAGRHNFNEVVFRDCVLPEDALIGNEGDGWTQVTSELGYERSGPERFLSAFKLFVELVRAVGPRPTDREAEVLGRLAAHLMTLRAMSISVAGMLQAGRVPNVEAAVVKDLGVNFEQELPEAARALREAAPSLGSPDRFERTLAAAILAVPAFSIQGGTREILRVVIARGLGLQ